MVLDKKEYEIKGDNIIISKKELEAWRDHYYKVASNTTNDGHLVWFYRGKHEVIVDLLKHFV